MRLLSAAVLCLGLMVASATAQTTQPAPGLIHRAGGGSTSQPASAKSMSDGAGAFRVVLSLTAVLGLILLMYWVSRRLLPRNVPGGGGTRAVQVLARAPLSPKHHVVLLQVGRRILVVAEAGAAQPLNTLCEIADPDEAAALIGQIRAEQSHSKSFAALLNNAAERFRSAETTQPADPDPLASTQEELDGLTQRVRVMTRHFERAGKA